MSETNYAVLAIELAVRTHPKDPFFAQARELVASCPRASSAAEKHATYSRLAELLVQHLDDCDRGCWDYFDEKGLAVDNYNMWRDGMLTAEGARATPSIDTSCPPDEPRYLTVTMAFLLIDDSPTDYIVSDRCQIAEDRLWARDVFRHVLETVPNLDFADVHSDLLYMIPGDPLYALTPEDLALPKFEYLRALE